MAKVDIAGLGVWSPTFRDWDALQHGLKSGEWSEDVVLQPDLIPPRERRRAPQLVKMAIEVMDQACKMAALSPPDVAVVFSSSMGDMQITDYMCRALAETPKLISPTRFHNSVHNAAPGYWSITTGAFTPASAVSAHEYTSAMAFLEAAIQVVEEKTPVVVVTQEIAAPLPLFDACPSTQAFSAAFLLTPPGENSSALASITFSLGDQHAASPNQDAALGDDFSDNYGARLLPLLTAIVRNEDHASFEFPVSQHASLALSVTPLRKQSD